MSLYYRSRAGSDVMPMERSSCKTRGLPLRRLYLKPLAEKPKFKGAVENNGDAYGKQINRRLQLNESNKLIHRQQLKILTASTEKGIN